MIKLKLRARRKIRLELLGFSPTEANALAKSTRQRYALKRPYIKRMIRDRQALVRQAREEDWSKARYRREVTAIYDEMGWGKKITRSSAWKMWRYFYNQSVKAGDEDFSPPAKKKPRMGQIGKGDVKAQKERWREREKQKPPPIGEVVFDEKLGKYVPKFY